MNGQNIELVITMTPDGAVGVRGPIEHLVLCYGLLEVARDAIQAKAAQKGQQRIVQPVIFPANGGMAG